MPRIEKKPHRTLQPRMQHVLPARRWTLTLSPPSPAALFSTSALSMLSDPPSRMVREREREWARAPNTDTFHLLLLCLPLLLQNNCSNPGRALEGLPNSALCMRACAHVDACAASGPDRDRLPTLLAWPPALECQEVLKHSI